MATPLESAHQIERLLDLERWDDARRLAVQALRAAPEDADLLCLVARAETGSERWAEAERLVGEALRRAPDHRGARALRFAVLFATNRHHEAEREILGLLRETPADSRLYVQYARLMLATFHLAKARALVAESLRLDPQSASARLLDALLSVVEGRAGAAQVKVAELVREAPDGESVTRTLLVVLTNNHRHQEALEIARALLRLRPADANLLDVLVELRAVTHWSSWPLRPLVRWGWGASIAIWAASAVGLAALGRVSPGFAGALGAALILYMVYSWVHLPLLRRWLRWRGF